MIKIKNKISTETTNGKSINKILGPLYVTNGSFSGEVNLQWDALQKANSYIIEISKNGSGWHQVDIVSDPQYSMQGLKSGKSYSFRVSAVFSNGDCIKSSAITKKIK